MSLAVLWVSILLVGAGVALGTWALVRRPGVSGARAILDERLARGEISVEEHGERREALGADGLRTLAGPLAGILLVLGLVGAAASATSAVGSGWDGMSRMMRGMPGMMGDGMMGDGMGGMMGGRTERNAPPPEAGAEEVGVAGGEFFFEPDEIRLEAGEPAELAFRNRGMMFHTLTIGELDVDLRAAPGESLSGGMGDVEPGRYTFLCTVPGHAEAGMRGVLVVEDGS